MKNQKLISLLFVALFSLTACNKKCSKEEFFKLASETSEPQYKSASVTCKAKSETKTEGMTTKYDVDTVFKFTCTNGIWDYADDIYSLSSAEQNFASSALVLINGNAKDFTSEEQFNNLDEKCLTFYSSPLGFRYNTKDINTDIGDELSSLTLNIKISGPADSTYLFDKENGAIIKYTDKSDLTTTISYDGQTITSQVKNNSIMTVKYFD